MNAIRILPWASMFAWRFSSRCPVPGLPTTPSASRAVIPNDAIFGETASIVTYQEIINFVISGSVAYVAWIQGIRLISSNRTLS
jgi:hypothetical protein